MTSSELAHGSFPNITCSLNSSTWKKNMEFSYCPDLVPEAGKRSPVTQLTRTKKQV